LKTCQKVKICFESIFTYMVILLRFKSRGQFTPTLLLQQCPASGWDFTLFRFQSDSSGLPLSCSEIYYRKEEKADFPKLFTTLWIITKHWQSSVSKYTVSGSIKQCGFSRHHVTTFPDSFLYSTTIRSQETSDTALNLPFL